MKKSFSLSLGQQGVILVLILLGLELAFIGWNVVMLVEAEEESREEEKHKDIAIKSSELLQKIYEAGDACGKFCFGQDRAQLMRYETAKQQIPGLISSMRAELESLKSGSKSHILKHPSVAAPAAKPDPDPATKSDPSSATMSNPSTSSNTDPIASVIASATSTGNQTLTDVQLLDKIEGNVKIGLAVLAEMKQSGEADDRETSQRVSYFAMRRLQPKIVALCRDQLEFQRMQKEIVAESPLWQKEQMDRRKGLLLAGGALNFIGAIALGLFFVRSITSRLKMMVMNSERLRKKQELLPPMRGGDEISQLDATFHEMTESLRGEEELLRASEQQIQSMIDQMPVGLLVTKSQGIEYANPMAESLFGYARGELIGKELGNLFAVGSEVSVDVGPLASFLEARSIDHVVELKAFKKTGDEFPVEFSMADVSLGRMSRRLAMVLDVTERHEIQKMRREFVAMVSHELRTPLNSVSGFLQLLPLGVFGKVSDEATAQAENADHNVDQLIGLINDLLDLEKLEAGKMELVKTKYVLEDIIDKSINDISEAANEREVSPYFEGCEVEANVDPERLQQCLTKLLSFMIAFTPQEGTINIAAERDAAGSITIRTNSTLLTIPEHLLKTIFERFQQLDLPGGRGSTGLGLALAKTIIEQHEGAIRVESTEGEGTTFWTHLPG